MSDRTGRVPKGTLTRHPADWFSDYLYTAGFQKYVNTAGPGEGYAAIALYNDTQDGRVLRIYGITAEFDGGGGGAVFFVKGTIGAEQDGATSIRPDRTAPAGVIYEEDSFVALGTPNPYIPDQGNNTGS